MLDEQQVAMDQSVPEQTGKQCRCGPALDLSCLWSDCSGRLFWDLDQTSFQRKTWKPQASYKKWNLVVLPVVSHPPDPEEDLQVFFCVEHVWRRIPKGKVSWRQAKKTDVDRQDFWTKVTTIMTEFVAEGVGRTGLGCLLPLFFPACIQTFSAEIWPDEMWIVVVFFVAGTK